jgi:hypothetical protein
VALSAPRPDQSRLWARPVGERTLRDSGTIFLATPELLAHLGVDAAATDPETLLLTTQTGHVYIAGHQPHPIPQRARTG